MLRRVILIGLVLCALGSGSSGDIRDIRYLNGGDWSSWGIDARMAFARGFILGATGTEAYAERGLLTEATSMYGVIDRDLVQSITEYYTGWKADQSRPIVTIIYENANGGKYERF